MMGNAPKNIEEIEANPWEASDKLAAIRRLSLRESQHASVCPMNNQPLHYEIKPGSSFI